MVMPVHPTGQAAVKGTAKRLRQSSGNTPSRTVVVKIIACGQCGDRFAIGHNPAFPNPELAERQAAWLEEQFVWDHIQENKHRSSITLPEANELK